MKKVEKMRRVIQLIKNYNEDLYIEMAEKELGELILHKLEFEPAPDYPSSYQLVDKDTPEEKEQIKKMMAWEPDGTLDVHGTLQTVSKMMPQVFEDLCQMMDDMADAFEKAKNDPGIKDLPPEQIKQIDDTIAACREAATKSRAQLPALNKSVSDIQSMPKPTTGPTVREAAKRADDELLEKMRMIAGLR
jgi:hypothetical protein